MFGGPNPFSLTLNNVSVEQNNPVKISGFINVTPVPEPATWALMLLGFGGVGLALRRRRKPALAQVA
ncbi:MAG: PEP-CTERM sorting domain-containing protein [Sphingomonas sp.]|nr:PEP-CTERM sorting domain-containing protein [Sphingomonas sp.]